MSKTELKGYELSRRWFDFAFENQGNVTGNHGCMFAWFVELNNRMGWKSEFAAPREQTMAAVGISSYNTYKKVFNDLVEWGFVRVVKESKNQWTANIIALSKFDNTQYKALDKALTTHLIKQDESTDTGTDTDTVAINKPINKETNKPINNTPLSPEGSGGFVSFNDVNTEKEKEEKSCEKKEENDEVYPFEEFWEDYDKKVGDKVKIIKKWDRLSKDSKLKIKDYIPRYKMSQPDKAFRKNPETFLNNKSWNDELVIKPQTQLSHANYKTREQRIAGVQELGSLADQILANAGYFGSSSH